MLAIEILEDWLREIGCTIVRSHIDVQKREQLIVIDLGPLRQEKITVRGSKVHTSLFALKGLGAFTGDLCDPEFFDKLHKAIREHRRIMEEY